MVGSGTSEISESSLADRGAEKKTNRAINIKKYFFEYIVKTV